MHSKPNPTVAEILAACKRIQLGWTDVEHRRRMCGRMPDGYGDVGDVIVQGAIPSIVLDPDTAAALNVPI